MFRGWAHILNRNAMNADTHIIQVLQSNSKSWQFIRYISMQENVSINFQKTGSWQQFITFTLAFE
jgi:hypothetical protein